MENGMRKLVYLFAALLATSCLTFAHGAPKLLAGDRLPAYLGVDRDGDNVESAKYAGKVMVVTFWASWCPPCRQELPRLDAIQRLAGKDKLQVVAINIEDRAMFMRASRVLSPLSIAISHDLGKGVSEAFGVNGIPHCVIVGRDGRILAVHVGYNESQLDRILGEVNEALAAK